MDAMTEWEAGDDPMLHDLWELQVSLEQGMLRDGAEAVAQRCAPEVADEDQEVWALYQPTVIPPRRWGGVRDGGYFTPYLRTPRLLRFKASEHGQQARAVDEVVGYGIGISKAQRPLNALQETPWRIDPQALAEAERRSLSGSDEMALRIAQRYREWSFYFPYCFDGEGRARPIPVHLHPEGSELARSLLVPA